MFVPFVHPRIESVFRVDKIHFLIPQKYKISLLPFFLIGKDTELRYQLQGFGIPVELIPVTGSGNIKFNSLKRWVRIRTIVETEVRIYGMARLARGTIVECPGSNDVIFKPGKKLPNHPGNILFRNLILSKEDEYTTIAAKRGLYRWLVTEIKFQHKGRFLKWNDDEYWTEIREDSQITTKMSTFCKNVLSKRKQIKKNASTIVDSSTNAFSSNLDEEILSHGNKRKRCEGLPICK